jgi:hypothetical protein
VAVKEKKKREKGKERPQRSENGDIASRVLYHARRRPHDHVFGWITSFWRCATLFSFSEKANALLICQNVIEACLDELHCFLTRVSIFANKLSTATVHFRVIYDQATKSYGASYLFAIC